MKRQCNGNVDECFECGKYYASFSPHFEKEKNKLREVITIYCCYGTSGTFDANTRRELIRIRI